MQRFALRHFAMRYALRQAALARMGPRRPPRRRGNICTSATDADHQAGHAAYAVVMSLAYSFRSRSLSGSNYTKERRDSSFMRPQNRQQVASVQVRDSTG